MIKMMNKEVLTMADLNNILVKFIETNKVKFGIEYKDSLETLQELLNEIKEDYKSLGDE
jgi:hypothetical protein